MRSSHRGRAVLSLYKRVLRCNKEISPTRKVYNESLATIRSTFKTQVLETDPVKFDKFISEEESKLSHWRMRLGEMRYNKITGISNSNSRLETTVYHSSNGKVIEGRSTSSIGRKTYDDLHTIDGDAMAKHKHLLDRQKRLGMYDPSQ